MPWESCTAELIEGKYCFGRYKTERGHMSYAYVFDHCPLADATPQLLEVLQAGRDHAIDQRMIDIEESSADIVRGILTVSAWAQKMGMVQAMGEVIARAFSGV